MSVFVRAEEFGFHSVFHVLVGGEAVKEGVSSRRGHTEETHILVTLILQAKGDRNAWIYDLARREFLPDINPLLEEVPVLIRADFLFTLQHRQNA